MRTIIILLLCFIVFLSSCSLESMVSTKCESDEDCILINKEIFEAGCCTDCEHSLENDNIALNRESHQKILDKYEEIQFKRCSNLLCSRSFCFPLGGQYDSRCIDGSCKKVQNDSNNYHFNFYNPNIKFVDKASVFFGIENPSKEKRCFYFQIFCVNGPNKFCDGSTQVGGYGSAEKWFKLFESTMVEGNKNKVMSSQVNIHNIAPGEYDFRWDVYSSSDECFEDYKPREEDFFASRTINVKVE